MKPIIQIAGIRDAEEARMLMSLGVEWLGLPLRLDVHKPDLTDAQAAEVVGVIKREGGGRCRAVLITYLNQASAIFDYMESLGFDAVQLHGPVAIEEVDKLRQLEMKKYGCRKYFVIKSLVVRAGNTDALRSDVKKFESYVDAFITDTFDPLTGASGATGKTHDWNISRELVRLTSKPVIIAGGLKSDNVGEAIRFTRPAGVDVHTGVEDKMGAKSPALVRAFLHASQEAFDNKQ